MSTINNVVPKPLFGLPRNLIDAKDDTTPILIKMISLGLNRDRKRKMTSKGGYYPLTATIYGKEFSDSDARLIILYQNPTQRNIAFWGAIDNMRDKNRATYYSVRAPDLALLREYAPALHSCTFDPVAFEAACPVWPRLMVRLTSSRKHAKEPADFKELMVWLQICTDLPKWDEFDESARLKLVNAVFAMMTISNTAWFINEALARCPGMQPYFQDLHQLNAEREGAVSPNHLKVDPETDEHQADSDADECDSESADYSEKSWDVALARLTRIALDLKVAPDMLLLDELRVLCGQLDALASQFGQLERRADEDFQMCWQALQGKLGALAGDAVPDWFNAAASVQLMARWEIARAACTGPEAIEVLAADCERAHREGDAVCTNIRNNAADARIVADEISSLEEQRETLTALGPRRTLGNQLIVLRQRQSDSEAALQQLQDHFLAVLSPWAEVFDLDTDYCDLLARETVALHTPNAESQRSPTTAIATEAEPKVPSSMGLGSADTPDSASVGLSLMLALPQLPLAATKMITHISTFSNEPALNTVAPAPYVMAQATPPAHGTFNPAAGERCRPIWRALADGHRSFAYQLARAFEDDRSAPLAPPSALLACVALADHMVLPDGAIVATLSHYYQTLSLSTLPAEAPDDWRTAIAVLTAAATLRPLLMAPASSAAAVVRDLHFDSRHQSVYQLLRMLGSHSERLQGFRLEVSTFKGTRTEAAWQQELNALKREAYDWLEQAKHLTMLYSPATKVWLHWLKPDALVQRLVSPIVRGAFDRLAAVKSLIAELGQPSNLEKQIQLADRRELGRSRGEDIQARALVQISGRLDEAVSLARRWILLVESRPQESDALDRRLNALRTEIFAMRQQVTIDLDKPLEHDDWNLVGTARAVLRRSLEGLWDLFDSACPPQSLELRPEELLGQDLLLVPMVEQDQHWRPELRGKDLVRLLIEAVDAAAFTPDSAFAQRLERDDMEGSERLLEVMGRQVGNDTTKLRELWQHRLIERRAALRRQIDVVRVEAETGVAYGMITEAERAAFDAQLVHMETSFDLVRRFWAAFDLLGGLSAQIAMRRLEKTEAVRIHLGDLAARGAASDDIAWVREVLSNGDVLTANELLQRLERGEALDRQAAGNQDRFATYFPQHANQIDAVLDTLSPADLRQKIIAAENFAGLEFGHIAAPQMRQAGDMVTAWLATKSRRNGAPEPLKKLLDALGFEVLMLVPGPQIGHRMEYELSTVPIDDRGVCPIPYFGSYANGRYRLVCVWQRPAEEDIVKLVGDSTIHRPTILLYFGRLTERKRRDASRLAKLQHRSFLLIDETLLVSLSAEGGSRLVALFETALPFAYSAPYDATSSVVPSEMFYGRLNELQAIQGQNGRCFIYGGRQLGKTALLRKAEKTFHAAQQGRYAKWIDLRAEGIGVNRAPAEIWLCIARELRGVGMIQSELPEPNPNIKGRVESFVNALKEMLAPSSDRRVLLLLDESDRFFELDRSNDFAETRRLKEIMEQTDRRFKVVFAGLHNVLRMTEDANHPLAHLGEPIKVGPLLEGLEWRDAEDLIRKPLEAAGFAFESRDLITRVLAQTNYYPSLIQLYCSHLLRQMLAALRNDPRLGGPRHVIQARHVDAAYKNAALRDEIRTKFNLTLQLDPRYEVIAYTLAYGALQGLNVVPDVLARDAKWQVTRWWPDGFANTSDLEFRVLLDEMVGLGVLRETRQGSYALRNPNVLLLLGNQDEIEDVLIKDRELPQEFDPSTFRARLAQESGNFKRHPLTFQQLAAITRPINAVTILSGSRAAGMDDILTFLRASVGDKFLLLLDHATDLAGFKLELDRLKHRAESGTTVVLVPTEVSWRREWVTNASDRLLRLSAKDRHAHVLFLCNPAQAWAMIASEDEPENQEVNHMFLSPWKDSFVRQWMEDCGLPNDQMLRRKVADATGYWPYLLYMAGLGGRDGGRVAERFDALRSSLDVPSARTELLVAFGLNLPEVQAVMSALAQFDDEIDEGELAQLTDIDSGKVGMVMRWARTMRLVISGSAARWRIEPTVRTLLQAQQDT